MTPQSFYPVHQPFSHASSPLSLPSIYLFLSFIDYNSDKEKCSCLSVYSSKGELDQFILVAKVVFPVFGCFSFDEGGLEFNVYSNELLS